jgi:phenylpropionate dioxygenase-like ring-hydroxylating dioxygenase large terminal subunit
MDLVVWNDTPELDTFGPKSDSKPRKRDAFKKLFGRKTEEDDTKVEGQWRVFVDKCPHRLVPLSEGRVESDGSLLCSYHGWRFDGEGECIDLPQSSESAFDKIKQNPKSNCNSFPVKIVNDVLWVWPDSGSDAVLESELTPLSVMDDIVDKDGNTVPEENIIYNTYNFRELPYGADYFLENVVDPAHVPVSHHNVVGNRYTGTSPINFKTDEAMTKDGFVITSLREDGSPQTRNEFKAPCLVSIDAQVTKEGARQILELYVTPSRPGFSHHLGRLVLVKDEKGDAPNGFKQFTLPIPVWMNHLLAAKFLNQDALFLHAQERNLYRDMKYKTSSDFDKKNDDINDTEDSNPLYKEMVFTPTIADKGVILFRDWLRLKAGGSIPYKNYEGMPPVDNEIVFDQWHSHTTKCKDCMGAYKNAIKIRQATAALAIAAAVLRPGGKITNAIVVGTLSGASFASHKIIGWLRRVEFSHAEND